MPIKEKIEVEMLSPLMAEFIPDYSDIVDLDDAEPLEGPDLVQYQPSIAEKVDEINRLGMPDNQPCNLIDYFNRNKDIKEKVERITMAVKEQDGVLYGCANLTLRENLTPEEYRVVGQYLRGQYSDGWGESLEQREIKVDGGELYLHFTVFPDQESCQHANGYGCSNNLFLHIGLTPFPVPGTVPSGQA